MKSAVCICCGARFVAKPRDVRCENPNLCASCANAPEEMWVPETDLEPEPGYPEPGNSICPMRN